MTNRQATTILNSSMTRSPLTNCFWVCLFIFLLLADNSGKHKHKWHIAGVQSATRSLLQVLFLIFILFLERLRFTSSFIPFATRRNMPKYSMLCRFDCSKNFKPSHVNEFIRLFNCDLLVKLLRMQRSS